MFTRLYLFYRYLTGYYLTGPRWPNYRMILINCVHFEINGLTLLLMKNSDVEGRKWTGILFNLNLRANNLGRWLGRGSALNQVSVLDAENVKMDDFKMSDLTQIGGRQITGCEKPNWNNTLYVIPSASYFYSFQIYFRYMNRIIWFR